MENNCKELNRKPKSNNKLQSIILERFNQQLDVIEGEE